MRKVLPSEKYFDDALPAEKENPRSAQVKLEHVAVTTDDVTPVVMELEIVR